MQVKLDSVIEGDNCAEVHFSPSPAIVLKVLLGSEKAYVVDLREVRPQDRMMAGKGREVR
jgi:hypothetical protein